MTTTPAPTVTTINKRDGVAAYGLYFDYIVHGTSGQLLRQERRFLVKNLLCVYSRTSGDKRAAWRVYPYADYDGAKQALIKSLERHKDNIELLYKPLLVEMTESDMVAVSTGEAPYGRFGGVVATEKAVGKIDDSTWKAAPKPSAAF